MRETAFRRAREMELPQYPRPDVPFCVATVRFETGLHEYYRAALPGLALRKHGLAEYIASDEAKDEDRIERAELLIISRPNSIQDITWMTTLQSYGKIIMVDTDDYPGALWQIDPTIAKVWTSEAIEAFNECVRQADGVTVSVPVMAERMRELGAKKVYTIDNALDPRSGRWNHDWDEDDGKIRIGWIAGFSHAPDAVVIETPIKTVLEKNPNAVFVTVGYMPPWAADLNPDQLEIRRAADFIEFAQFAADIDIAVGPLAGNDFNQYRSQVKCWESICAGSVFVGSNYGPYTFLPKCFDVCEGDEEWIETLNSLIQSDKRRERTYNASFKQLMKHSIDWKVGDWYNAYSHTVKRSEIYQRSIRALELARRDLINGNANTRDYRTNDLIQ